MKLLLAQHRHQLLYSSDAVDEYQNRRSRNGTKRIQQRILLWKEWTMSTNRVVEVVNTVFTDTSELSPPFISSTALIRRVIGFSTQLLMRRFTDIGKVAEHSMVCVLEEGSWLAIYCESES